MHFLSQIQSQVHATVQQASGSASGGTVLFTDDNFDLFATYTTTTTVLGGSTYTFTSERTILFNLPLTNFSQTFQIESAVYDENSTELQRVEDESTTDIAGAYLTASTSNNPVQVGDGSVIHTFTIGLHPDSPLDATDITVSPNEHAIAFYCSMFSL